jgi:hypothetical protein
MQDRLGRNGGRNMYERRRSDAAKRKLRIHGLPASAPHCQIQNRERFCASGMDGLGWVESELESKSETDLHACGYGYTEDAGVGGRAKNSKEAGRQSNIIEYIRVRNGIGKGRSIVVA